MVAANQMSSEPYEMKQGFGYAEQPTRTIKHHKLCLMSVKHGSQGNRQLVAMPTADILIWHQAEWLQNAIFSRRNNRVVQCHAVSICDQILWPCVWMMGRFKMPHRRKTDKPNSENDSCSSPITLLTCEVRHTDLVSASI